MRRISLRISTRSFASRFESGSSIKNACGCRTIARPIATRWRCPPESAAGFFLRCAVRPSIVAAACTRSSITAFGSCRRRRANAMLSYTDIWG